MDSNAASQLDELCRSAFVTECLGDFPKAIQQHEEALKGLTKLAESNISSVDMGRKETARKQLKSHLARLHVLRQRADLATERPFVFSPTSFSAQQELAASPTLSLDQLRLSQYEGPRKTDPNVEIPDSIVHLLSPPAPVYSPILSTLTPTTYHIYHSVEPKGYLSGHFHYMKAKDPVTQQTRYVLRAHKARRRQIHEAAFLRSSEYAGPPAIKITIVPLDVRRTGGSGSGSLYGRNMILQSAMGVVEETLDRQLKPSWGPRRFSYGGRQFVWKERSGISNVMAPEDLWEVKRVWPRPGSKTGKMLEETVGEKIVWGESKGRMHSICFLDIRGGADQLFREYLLASQMARLLVMAYGHT